MKATVRTQSTGPAARASRADAPDRRLSRLEKDFLPHTAMIARWIRHKFPHEPDVDDIVQDALYRVIAAPDVAGIRHPRAYLTRIAYTLVVDRARRRTASPVETIGDMVELAALEVPDDTPAIDRALCARETWLRVNKAYADLAPPHRDTVRLRRSEGLRVRDTAQRLAISEAAIEKRMEAAMKRLREAAKEPEPWLAPAVTPGLGFAIRDGRRTRPKRKQDLD